MDKFYKTRLLNNDGSPTRIPVGAGKANPLDLTFMSRDLLNSVNWEVKSENLGSDHLVVGMELELGMNVESIRCIRAKIDSNKFHDGINKIEINDGVKEEATTTPAII